MFTSELNTLDLYYSNPMDHFLGPDHEIKTSFESGFSSTYSAYNPTGNSKDLQYKTSQDLFSQRSEATESQFSNNMDYQKYISQNLLLGKGARSPLSIIPYKCKDNDDKRKQEKTDIQNECNENFMKEIRDKLDTLNEDIKKMNSDITHHNNTIKILQEEVSNIKEKLVSTEQSIAKKFEKMGESCKEIIKLNKKDEEDRNKMCTKITENKENIENMVKKLDDNIEQNERNLLESIKKISKKYEDINKKQQQNIQELTR